MTFASLWKSLRTAWQSRPFAIILPIVALGWYWFKHGHILALATFGNGGSLPAWPDLIAGVALLTTKFERLTALFLGAPAPETLPAPVASPVLVKGPGDVPKVGGLLLLIGLCFALQACAHVDAIAKDVDSCVKADGPAAVVDLEKAAPKIVEDILMCAPEGEAAIPACVEEGLASLVTALGPDGKRFELCVVNTIENDPAAAKLAKQRARAMRVKLVREANGR